jgi:hypothetical protein
MLMLYSIWLSNLLNLLLLSLLLQHLDHFYGHYKKQKALKIKYFVPLYHLLTFILHHLNS